MKISEWMTPEIFEEGIQETLAGLRAQASALSGQPKKEWDICLESFKAALLVVEKSPDADTAILSLTALIRFAQEMSEGDRNG